MAKATARHILVNTEAEAIRLKGEIEGGVNFSKVARENSKCPSGKQGGSLGEFFRGQMVPEFDKVVFTGDLNKVLGPVKTQFGFHLIEVTKRID